MTENINARTIFSSSLSVKNWSQSFQWQMELKMSRESTSNDRNKVLLWLSFFPHFFCYAMSRCVASRHNCLGLWFYFIFTVLHIMFSLVLSALHSLSRERLIIKTKQNRNLYKKKRKRDTTTTTLNAGRYLVYSI